MTVTTTSADESLWLETAAPSTFPALSGDLKVDIAVLGGGIAGLSTALQLKREGATVAVLEAARVGAGVTGCTTAKVSALQSTIYSTIFSRHGSEAAVAYAEASLAGVELIAQLAHEERIDCELERRPACTYAAVRSDRSTVEQEADAARRAGLAVQLREEIDLPFSTEGAVELADQIQLQPVRFVQGLASAVDGDGSHVLEQTRAMAVNEGSPCHVQT
ncbi:MAG: FAD-binding oxidoreductase, partial [Planctomycetes bacterium]|nr:FAD-binding oxidoreductase [Planctomycetota bacterium]